MKTLLIGLCAVLTLVLITGALVLWGPLDTLLPDSTKERINRVLPDAFKVERPGVVSINTDLPSGDPNGLAPGVVGWSVMGRDGLSVEVLPFAPIASTTPETGSTTPNTSGSPLPQHDVILVGSQEGGEPYVIMYFAHDQSFTITLLREPLGESRRLGEAELLSILGISEAAACRLNHAVLTPWWVNGFYSGYNLDFSFCSGAPQF